CLDGALPPSLLGFRTRPATASEQAGDPRRREAAWRRQTVAPPWAGGKSAPRRGGTTLQCRAVPRPLPAEKYPASHMSKGTSYCLAPPQRNAGRTHEGLSGTDLDRR